MTLTQTSWTFTSPAPQRQVIRAVAVPAPTSSSAAADGLMTVKDVAVACQLSETAVRRAIADGELPAVKLRSRMRIVRAEFDTWLSSQRHAPTHGRPSPQPVLRGRRPAPVGTFRALAQAEPVRATGPR
jgi:excisionase family DNA binding protein